MDCEDVPTLEKRLETLCAYSAEEIFGTEELGAFLRRVFLITVEAAELPSSAKLMKVEVPSMYLDP